MTNTRKIMVHFKSKTADECGFAQLYDVEVEADYSLHRNVDQAYDTARQKLAERIGDTSNFVVFRSDGW